MSSEKLSSENPTPSATPADPTSADSTPGAGPEGRAGRCGPGGRCARRGSRGGRGGLRRLFKGAALLALIAVPISWAWAGPMGHGGSCGRHGWGGEVDAASIEAHMSRGAEHLFGRVDATDEQMAQIDTLIGELAPRLAALHAEKGDLHEEALDAVSAETVDPAALEGVRQHGLALADQGSRVVVDAVIGLSTILTVEQRQELVEGWSERDERPGRAR